METAYHRHLEKPHFPVDNQGWHPIASTLPLAKLGLLRLCSPWEESSLWMVTWWSTCLVSIRKERDENNFAVSFFTVVTQYLGLPSFLRDSNHCYDSLRYSLWCALHRNEFEVLFDLRAWLSSTITHTIKCVTFLYRRSGPIVLRDVQL